MEEINSKTSRAWLTKETSLKMLQKNEQGLKTTC